MNFSIGLKKEWLPPHKHKFYEIIIYTKGCGVFHTPKKDIKIEPGKIIIIPPGTVHESLDLSDDSERIYINGEFNHLLFLPSLTVITDNDENEGILFAKMIYTNRYSDSKYVTALINAFLYYLLQNIKMENEIFLTIKRIVDNISNNFYNCNIDLNSILKESGYAEDYIRFQFKKIIGKTPTQFLTQVRVNHACYMIDTYKNQLSLSEISERCGYTDYVYFSRRFKQIMGMSPRKYMEDN